MKTTSKKEKLYVSVYFDKILDYVSFSKYGQQYVHLIHITDDPSDRSAQLNAVGMTAGKESGPISWDRLPCFLHDQWRRTNCVEVGNIEGLRDFLEESVILAFQMPKIVWNAVDMTCTYALHANGIELEPDDVKDHFGYLVCFDEIEIIKLCSAFLNGERERAEELSEFMDRLFSDYLKSTVNRAVFDFGHHNPIAVD